MSTIVDLVNKDVPCEPEISFSRSDIEKRMGFPAGRYTSPGPLLSPLTAIILTVALYAALALFPKSLVTQSLTQRGPVPYAIVLLAFWSLAILFIKQRKLSLQRRTLLLSLLPSEDPGFVLTPASAQAILEKLYRGVDDPARFMLTRRIQNALSNLRNMGRIGDVDEVLKTHAENDEGQMDSSYTLVRGFIWAMPVLGFIGTVLGLSISLGSFGSVISSADHMDQLKGALESVTGGLSTAFETTLHGLLGVLLVHMLMISLRRSEERFLDDCKDYCQKYIIGRLRLIDTANAQ